MGGAIPLGREPNPARQLPADPTSPRGAPPPILPLPRKEKQGLAGKHRRGSALEAGAWLLRRDPTRERRRHLVSGDCGEASEKFINFLSS